MPLEERIRTLAERGVLTPEDAAILLRGEALLPVHVADKMIENVVGVFGLPLALAPNFLVNDHEYVVPMVVEEPSIVAAVSGAAKLVRDSGGFTVSAMEPVMIGQIQVIGIGDPDRAIQAVYNAQPQLLARANDCQPNLLARGGGARNIEFFKYRLPDGAWTVVLHLLVDTRDAMGANIVNTMCEALAPEVEALAGGEVILRILSNLADKSLVTARAEIALEQLAAGDHSAERVRDGIVLANDFANTDPHRAATHNKGIMNGIDAVAIATGNDWRAIEAGAHAFAARDGAYRSLTSWTVTDSGDLAGELRLPLKTGIVGGSLSTNPGARMGLRVTGVQTATELSLLMAATGLAQNFAALRALVSSGIQAGHMRLHARSVAATAGVADAHFARVVDDLIASGEVKAWKAREIADRIRSPGMAPLQNAAQGKACGKVILFGEHAVVYDRHALGLPLPSAVTAEVAECESGVELSVPDWNISTNWRGEDIAPGGAAMIVALIMREMGVPNRGFEIRASSRIPVGMGLGSSAAFAVAVIRAFDALLGRKLPDAKINELAFQCEKLSHGDPSGIDNNIATYGQAVLFSKATSSRTIPVPLPEPPPLVIASGVTRGLTRDMVAAVRARYEKNKALYTMIFDEIDEISTAGAAALREADYEYLGSMMNVCHGLLNAIEVSTPELESMVAVARKAGAVGAKLTGAGGGGCIVALCPGAVAEVSAALADAGCAVVLLVEAQ